MSAKEIGWHRVTRGGGTEVEDWLGAGTEPFEVLAWHHDAFELPPGATSLYSSGFCPDQAFVRGNLAATVAHVEVTAELLARWIDIYGYDLEPLSETVQSPEAVLAGRAAKVRDMQAAVTDPLYRRWLGPVRERARG